MRSIPGPVASFRSQLGSASSWLGKPDVARVRHKYIEYDMAASFPLREVYPPLLKERRRLSSRSHGPALPGPLRGSGPRNPKGASMGEIAPRHWYLVLHRAQNLFAHVHRKCQI